MGPIYNREVDFHHMEGPLRWIKICSPPFNRVLIFLSTQNDTLLADMVTMMALEEE